MIQRYRFLLEAVAIIVITGIIGVLVAFSGTFGRSETTTAIVINEVAPAPLEERPATHQWFELYNRTGDWQTLEGWTVDGAASISLTIPRLVLAPQGYAIVALSRDQFLAEHPDFLGQVVGLSVPAGASGMDVAKGYLVLRDAQGRAIDAVNWGRPDQPPSGVELWKEPGFEPGAGWAMAPVSLFKLESDLATDLAADLDGGVIPDGLRQQLAGKGLTLESATVEVRAAGSEWRIVDGVEADKRFYIIQKKEEPAKVYLQVFLQAQYTLERRPLGLDTDRPSDFIRQPFPSPGTVTLPSATQGANSFFIDWTNAAAVAGGILLWIAFVFIALVARRFEALTQQRTFWWAMLAAPSGIVAYALIQAYGFLVRGRMLLDEQWVGFLVLFASAILCTVLVFLFRRRAKSILEG